MKKAGLIITLFGLAASLAGCASPYFIDDPFEAYVARRDTVSAGPGNAVAANEVAQIVDPWPSYVRNKNIPGDGCRMAEAAYRYSHGGPDDNSGSKSATSNSASTTNIQINQPGANTSNSNNDKRC